MNDHTPFIQAVLVNPKDDLPRTVYADWLDAHAGWDKCPSGCKEGKPDPKRFYTGDRWVLVPDKCPTCDGTGEVSNGYAERAQFIRVQCELEQNPYCAQVRTGLCDKIEVGSQCPQCRSISGKSYTCVYHDGGPYESGWERCQYCFGTGTVFVTCPDWTRACELHKLEKEALLTYKSHFPKALDFHLGKIDPEVMAEGIYWTRGFPSGLVCTQSLWDINKVDWQARYPLEEILILPPTSGLLRYAHLWDSQRGGDFLPSHLLPIVHETTP